MLAGVVAIMAPSAASGAASAAAIDPKYVALTLASTAFPALATIVKDKIFRDAKAALGRPLDVFVVNTSGSAAQASYGGCNQCHSLHMCARAWELAFPVAC